VFSYYARIPLNAIQIFDQNTSIPIPTWCIPRYLRPFLKYSMDECEGVGELVKMSCNMSSSKNVGILPFWRILSPVIKMTKMDLIIINI
jgi:hypothetical protein